MPDLPYADPISPRLVTGRCLNAPTSPTAALYVNCPSLSQSDRQKANWEPHGGTYPSVGTECLVAFDETGGRWVIAWVGGYS